MTYVREQSSAELAVHMRSLQKMPGWHDPLADRLWQEVEALKALIAENEHLAMCARKWEEAAMQWGAERDHLKAEVAGLKTGYEAYERVNAELKAENKRIERNRDMWKGQVERQAGELTKLRKALADLLELYDTDEGCRSLPQYIAGRAAMGKGGEA
ncbi:hypothetical protein ACIOWK_32540 [Pseudomonas protegens]|uniref:hypothetical protein n=1 Tax=Pseudomonas protegens TaxID=380021 RepID=UPI0038219B54